MPPGREGVEVHASRPVGEWRIAGTEDLVSAELHAELLLQRVLHVDLREDPESFSLEQVRELLQYLVVARRRGLAYAEVGT